jgi:hypothetical protein
MHLDSFRSTRVGLIIGCVLMLMLILWFFLAKVSIHETSEDVRLSQDGTFLVVFRDEAFSRIQPGMEALIRIFTIGDQPPLSIEGVVFDSDSNSNTIEIITLDESFFDIPAGDNISAQADVEVERVTPFHLVQRYTGQFAGSEQTSQNSPADLPAGNP